MDMKSYNKTQVEIETNMILKACTAGPQLLQIDHLSLKNNKIDSAMIKRLNNKLYNGA